MEIQGWPHRADYIESQASGQCSALTSMLVPTMPTLIGGGPFRPTVTVGSLTPQCKRVVNRIAGMPAANVAKFGHLLRIEPSQSMASSTSNKYLRILISGFNHEDLETYLGSGNSFALESRRGFDVMRCRSTGFCNNGLNVDDVDWKKIVDICIPHQPDNASRTNRVANASRTNHHKQDLAKNVGTGTHNRNLTSTLC
eukprot:465691-Prorocentrum_minimum.AAC.3